MLSDVPGAPHRGNGIVILVSMNPAHALGKPTRDRIRLLAGLGIEKKNGRVLGAALVASHAGEMIGEMSLAITAGLSLATVGRTIHPYPTQAEVWKRLGDAWSRTRLTPRIRGLFERYLRWKR